MIFVPRFAADPISQCFSITRRVKDGLRPPLARWPSAILDPAPDRKKDSANIGAAARGVARANESSKEPTSSQGRDPSPPLVEPPEPLGVGVSTPTQSCTDRSRRY
ncbi:hypothetical protein GCM10010197_45160 [Nocardioides luteus]|uniref:Uncharacterized protein n=1 Tax=Nocardioides luteus TaxID=1844 RepID=A0ABQ5T2B6_9ACTN|nr:hypothetical protein GCM10010197_45160 [Nocardioides luteus]GLJ69990.1 hypothetical protein GCM10017579_40260 [Nocardioides luteus]